MERPDLTYITQQRFIVVNGKKRISIYDSDVNYVATEEKENRPNQYLAAISKLPELVQCAEMLFDMTLDKPNSIIHKMVSDLLNELKEEK